MKTCKLWMHILIGGMMLWTHGWAQGTPPDLPEIVPPSPEAAAFAKYGEIPVSTYSGIPKVEVPLYQVTQGDISLPITLSYHASGIKVDEEASWVGLGWVLNAGGVISRTVMGEDDLIGAAYFKSVLPDLVKTYVSLPNYYQSVGGAILESDCDFDFFQTGGVPLNIPDQYLSFSNYDFQPDLYSFNFGMYSGTFIVKRDKSGNPETVISNTYDKLQIKPFFSTSNHVLDKFEVTDPNGMVYTFEEIEDYIQPNTGLLIPTAWYLTEIEAPSGKSISLNYIHRTTNIRNIGARKSSGIAPICIQVAGSQGCSNSIWAETTVEGYREYNIPVLAEIDFGYGVVQFQSTHTQRLDLPNGERLNAMLVYMREADGDLAPDPLKRYGFQYGYFESTTLDADGGQNYFSLDHLKKRLKLEKVIQESVDQSIPIGDCPTHTFSYIESPGLPAKTSLARDHWGYYNGRTGNNTLYPKFKGIPANFLMQVREYAGADRDADGNFTDAFSLRSITYPTGGTTTLTLESNTYDYELSAVNDDYGAFVPDLENDKVEGTVPTFQTQTIPFEIKANAFPVAALGYAKVDFRCFFRCKSVCPTVVNSNAVYARVHYQNGQVVPNSTIGMTNTTCVPPIGNCIGMDGEMPLELAPGNYYIEVKVNHGGFADAKVTLAYDFVPEIVEGGGLRVAQVVTSDGVDPANDLYRTYDYHYWEDQNGDGVAEEHSHGKRLSRPVYGFFKDVYSVKQSSGTGGPFTCDFSEARQFYVAANSLVSERGTGGVIGYTQVTESIGKEANTYGVGGKTVYEYRNIPDFVKSYEFRRRPGILNFPAEPGGLNGLLLEEEQFKYEAGGTFTPVRKVSYTYEQPDEFEVVFGIYRDLLTLNGSCQGVSGLAPCSRAISFIYPVVVKEWPMLTSTTEEVFDPSGSSSISTMTTQVYDQTIHQLRSSSTTNSDGKTQTTEYVYAEEGGADVPAQMYDPADPDYKHMPGPVVEEIYYKGSTLVGRTTYRFDYESMKDRILLGRQRVYPTGGANYVDLDMQYNEEANLSQVQRSAGMPISYTWNRTGANPTSEVVNAIEDRIAYTSFEEAGTFTASQEPTVEDGGWEIVRSTSGSGGWVSQAGYVQTGKKGFHIQPNNYRKVRKTQLPAGEYILSYWYKGGRLKASVSGGSTYYSHGASDPDPSVMTYHEEVITVGSNGTLTLQPVSGDWWTFIDELRLYPAEAQMKTYCYDRSLRVITVTDVNNHSQYYTYDALGRLKYVQDQDGHFVQGYEYNYQP